MGGRDEEIYWQPGSLSCTCHGCYHFCIIWQSPASLLSSIKRSFITKSKLQHFVLLAKFLKQHQHSPLLTSLRLLNSDETASAHGKVLRVPSITECSYWQSKNMLAHRAFTWWVMGCDLGWGLLMFCFVFLITALHLTRAGTQQFWVCAEWPDKSIHL